MATLYHNLGGLEHARDRFARAEIFARRAVQILEHVLDDRHLDVAADLAALGAIVAGRGNHGEAEVLYCRALDIFARVFGPEHYEVAVTLNNLATLCQATGR